MEFKGADILSAAQFQRGDIELVLKTAKKLEPFAKKEKISNLLNGKVLASLFYEPSTRTRLSFETAMLRLDGRVLTVTGTEFSSLSKGESLSDTGKVVSLYADAIVIRHPEQGSCEKLAQGSNVPVINAGDGANEHPTQALLDIYTIQKELGLIDGLRIAMIGDLKYGRTVHSLSRALSCFNISFIFVSPQALKMPDEILLYLREKGVSFKETADFEESLKDIDVCYMTRVQQERFSDKKEHEQYKDMYILTKELAESKNKNLVILHPLPRTSEIKENTDELKGAAYFRQAQNGIAVRMALLSLVLGKNT